MRRPSQYPNVPYAAYVDLVGPDVEQTFLNRTQEGLADLIGGSFGRSATVVKDEFTTITYHTTARELLETWLTVGATSTWRPPTAIGQHGVLGVKASGAVLVQHLLQDAQYWIGANDFTVNISACIDDRASLDTVANLGWFGGLRDTLPTDVLFVAGSDQANWQTKIGAIVTDTGVPIVDGQFYDLEFCREAGTLYAYIDGALVVTQAYVTALQAANRQLGLNCPVGVLNKGYGVDYFRLGIMR